MPTASRVKAVVITADQIGSRKSVDKVPDALSALDAVPLGRGSRAFARTAGDEIQGLVTDSRAALAVIEQLTRIGGWRIGFGIGTVAQPVPEDVRAATGTAFVHAREALNAAHSAPQDLRVMADEAAAAADLEAVLWLLLATWRRRTEAGWQTALAAAAGEQQQHIAAELGITASAVSQRLRSAAHAETEAGLALAVRLLDVAREAVGGSR